MEPFDEALDRETWSLYNQRLQWDLELATKRRKRPQEIVDNLENLFKVQDEELDRPMEEEDEDRPDRSLPDGQLVTQFTGPATELIFTYRNCARRPGDERCVLQGGSLI
jgi:Kinetochore protein Mis14 like